MICSYVSYLLNIPVLPDSVCVSCLFWIQQVARELWANVIARGVTLFRFWCFLYRYERFVIRKLCIFMESKTDIYSHMNNYANWLNVHVYLLWNLLNTCISAKDWPPKATNKLKLWYRIIFFSITYLFELFPGRLLICRHTPGKWGWTIHTWRVTL